MNQCFGRGKPLMLAAALASIPLLGAPVQAHHLLELNHLAPTPWTGLLSGLAHPVLGPDHLLFLLALGLVGLQHRRRWMLGLLVVGLLGGLVGLQWPALPGAESLLALTLVAEALTLLGRLPAVVMLPAMALHGYVLSASVLGWSSAPIGTYLIGLLISQGLLLLLALNVLQTAAAGLPSRWHRRLALLLMALGGALAVGTVLA